LVSYLINFSRGRRAHYSFLAALKLENRFKFHDEKISKENFQIQLDESDRRIGEKG
jgi:hypothetical protein